MMGGILGLLPGASTAHALQGSCPPPLPLPSLKLQQKEGTLQGLGTGIKEAKTADSDKKANRTECACPAPVPASTRVCGWKRSQEVAEVKAHAQLGRWIIFPLKVPEAA